MGRRQDNQAAPNHDGNEYYENGEIPSWGDVFFFLKRYFQDEWIGIIGNFILFCGCLYTFIFGLALMGESTMVLGGCNAVGILEYADNPVALVMAGILATAIFQTSVVTNFIVGSLVGNMLTIHDCIFVTIGANVGKSVLNTIIALSNFTDVSLLERSIAGAAVNDIHLILTMVVLIPLECATNILYRMGEAILPVDLSSVTYKWNGVIDLAVRPFTNKLIIANKDLYIQIISGDMEKCSDAYPIVCQDGVRSYEACNTGLISCDPVSGFCPIFFKDGNDQLKDEIVAIITLGIAVCFILLSIFGMIKLINKMLMNTPLEVVAKLSNQNPIVSMILGCGSVFLLNSASITESCLMPYVATGIIELEQVLPWCLGSNFGIAMTCMLSAWYSGNEGHLHVTISNLFFHVFGTMIWYIFPVMREFPIHGSLISGIIVRMWRFASLFYFGFTFFLCPLMVYGITKLLYSKNTFFISLGGIIVCVLIFLIGLSIFVWFWRSGRERFILYFEEPTSNKMSIPDDVSEDSFRNNDEGTDYRSDLSSIGFEEVKLARGQGRKEHATKITSKKLNSMRIQAITAPSSSGRNGRKRLVKNAAVEKTENCCCNDPTFLAV